MQRTRDWFGAAAAALLWSVSARAYRPFDGTDAEVADLRELELEVGPVGYLREGRARSIVSPALVVNYGFLRRWEAVLEGRNELPTNGDPAARLTDTALSVKYVLREGELQGSSGLSVAFEPGLLLPETTSGTAFGFSTGFIVSHRGALGTFHANVEGARSREHDFMGFVSLILEGPDTWPLRPVTELAEGWHFDEPWPRTGAHTALVGAILPLCDRYSLDGGYRVGREDGMPVGEVRIGFTWGVDLGGPVSARAASRSRR